MKTLPNQNAQTMTSEATLDLAPDTKLDSRAKLDEIHIYAGTAGHSAWFSEDLGESWVHPNSHSGMYLEARVWAFSSHPALPGSLHAGTDEGVFRWDER